MEKEKERLISENMNYVKAMADHHRGKGVDFEDLVSEGTLALIEAAGKYDPNRGDKFVGYAKPFIEKAMKKAIEAQANGGMQVDRQVSKSGRKAAPVSMDAPVKEGSKYTLLDILADPNATQGDEDTTLRKMTEDLKEAVKTLEEREQQVVNAFYGLEHARLTMAEIAEDMGLKRERVRQIRDKALRKMARTTNNPILRELLRN